MKKIICLSALILSMCISATVFGAESEEGFIPTFEQTASAYLDQDGNEVRVTVDLTDGWSADFARGAVYLYDGKADENAEAVAIGITLDEEVFNEYVATAPEQDNYREFARSFAYTEEDGTNDYFFSLGPDAYFMIAVNPEADGDAVSSRISVELSDVPMSDTSKIFSEDDIAAASVKILDEFNTWNGCELHTFVYAGDECMTEENLKWINSLGEGNEYTQCIEFLMNFHSPTDDADLEQTAWQPDFEYEDYQWWLGRVGDGEWVIVSHGY
jgi:D-alanyl-D-alanine carboxypeptidase